MFFANSRNGYTNKKLGYQWLNKVFEPATVSGVGNQKRILLLDGQKSHLTGQFLGFCHNHNILPMCLPPHSMHLLQPLNVGCFSSVAHHYCKGVEFSGCHRIHGIFKHEFLEIHLKACAYGLSPINFASAY